ncbi:MAG: hypothetical protein ACOCP8_07485 [archaeon]
MEKKEYVEKILKSEDPLKALNFIIDNFYDDINVKNEEQNNFISEVVSFNDEIKSVKSELEKIVFKENITDEDLNKIELKDESEKESYLNEFKLDWFD